MDWHAPQGWTFPESQLRQSEEKPPEWIELRSHMKIRWGEPHTVTSVDGAFRSGAFDQNESFTFKFDKPGTYQYLCSIHPRMKAAVIVQ